LEGEAQHEGRHSAVKLDRTDTTLDLSLTAKEAEERYLREGEGVYIDLREKLKQ